MALSPLDPAVYHRVQALTSAAGARMATAAQASEAKRREADAEGRHGSDEVFLSGSPLPTAAPPPTPPPAEPPPPAPTRPLASHAPAVLLEVMALPQDGPAVIDGGGKLDYGQHLQLMARAAAAGTSTVRTGGTVSHDVQIHGADPKELAHIESALQDLAKVDRYDLILHDVRNVYVADNLGTGHGGNPVAGVAVKLSSGETAIVLSRLRGQSDRNALESGNRVREVLYHEIAHVVDNRHNLSGLASPLYGNGDAEKIGSGGDFVSRYAATSWREDYAETFSQFFVGRSSKYFRECSDAEVVDLTLFGHDGRGAAVEKMRRIPQDLSPELHVKDFLSQYVDAHPEAGGSRAVLRRFYDDGEFRRGFVADVVGARPAVPHDAVYSYMQSVADLFGEAAAPQGGRPD